MPESLRLRFDVWDSSAVRYLADVVGGETVWSIDGPYIMVNGERANYGDWFVRREDGFHVQEDPDAE